MALRTSLWKIQGDALTDIGTARLDNESRLEDWILSDSSVLGLDLLFVGRQVKTDYGGRIDLLGLDVEANGVIVELKRDKTPRDVVAQMLDYAAWVSDLSFDELDDLAQKHGHKSLSKAFQEHFRKSLPEVVNASHSMVVVASELDDASERIIDYLQDWAGLSISAVFFSFYEVDGTELLARSWLHDPEEVAEHAASRKRGGLAETEDGRIAGPLAYEQAKKGAIRWVGRRGGKGQIETDIKSGMWKTRPYSVNWTSETAPRPNTWIPASDFAGMVDTHQPADGR